MMRSIEYSAAFARIKAIRGELLSKEVLEEALNAKSLDGLIDIIKKTPYGRGKSISYSREGLERIIKNSLVEIYFKVLQFMPKRSQTFLRATMKRFEIDNIKRVLRSKLSNEEDIQKDSLYELKDFSSFDISDLISAKNLAEAIEILRKTPYKEYIEGKLPEEELETLFGIEIALDYGFFKELIELNESLEPLDKEINKWYLGMQCDLINLGWIVRAKNFFNFREEKIFSYTFPFGKYLNEEKLKQLIHAKNMEEFLKPLVNTPWREEVEKAGDLKNP
ncbi:MAG: H(+)-transporting two-sector ATPase, partial [bacterium 42_11]